jgi:hypothetical protein
LFRSRVDWAEVVRLDCRSFQPKINEKSRSLSAPRASPASADTSITAGERLHRHHKEREMWIDRQAAAAAAGGCAVRPRVGRVPWLFHANG